MNQISACPMLVSLTTGVFQVEYLHEGREFVRIATGLGARALQEMGVRDIGVEGFHKADAAAEGAHLGVWYYTDKELETRVSLEEFGDA
jgi:hypothetical protein